MNKENLQLKEVTDQLNEENKQLKEKIAVLSKNSKNSSKSPSSDIVKKKKACQDGKKRKIGAQPGHKKHERKPFPQEEVDNFFDYSLSFCPVCQGTLEPYLGKIKVFQQVELKEFPLEVNEHRSYPFCCPQCKKVHYAPIPDDIIKAGLCGNSLTALVAYMKFSLHASFSAMRKFFTDVVKIQISRGQLSKLIHKLGNSLEFSYNQLLSRIPRENKINADETGHKENGNKFCTWCFKAELYVLFKIHKSRSSDVLIEVLGKEFNGLLGCDYFSAYRKYMKDFNITVQFCIAHLIGNIRFLLSLADKKTKSYGEKLLEKIKTMFKIIHHSQANTPEQTKGQLLPIQKEIIHIASNEVPSQLDKNGKKTKREAQAIAKRFRDFEDAYFQFILTPEFDPTNNIAEQAIRFVTINRHFTQGTRSKKGRINCERLWTVLATCQLQGRSAFEFIKKAVEVYFRANSPPSLIPE